MKNDIIVVEFLFWNDNEEIIHINKDIVVFYL